MKEWYQQRYCLVLPLRFTSATSLGYSSLWTIITFHPVLQTNLVKQYNNSPSPEVHVIGHGGFQKFPDTSFGRCHQNSLRHIFPVPPMLWNASASFRGTLLFSTYNDYDQESDEISTAALAASTKCSSTDVDEIVNWIYSCVFITMTSSWPMIASLRRLYTSVASTKNVGWRDEFFSNVKVHRFLNLRRSTHFARTKENINVSRLLLTCEI
jgi:hypothetical protein